ncbi:MAG TPA: hypothetical protein VGZ24_08245, partial [Chthoniobacterales bacterium]|nr:hypothetical protein [Chthoniobacterales bacterium]
MFIHTNDDTLWLNLNQTGIRRVKYSGEQLHGRRVRRIGLGNVLTTEQDLRNVWQLIPTTPSEKMPPNSWLAGAVLACDPG